jgi:hypothetical protein
VEVEELEAGPADPAHLGIFELKWELLSRAPMADHLADKETFVKKRVNRRGYVRLIASLTI